MSNQSSPGGYLVKDFADGWYWTPNASLDHASGATIWSVAHNRYETDPLSAGPAPEGGAVSYAAWDVVRRVANLTVAGDDPLQDPAFAKYPAIADLVSKAQSALATREEAPAEALERDKRAWIDRWNAIEAAARDALHTMNELLEAPNLKRMQYALGERRDTLRDALNLPEAGTAWMRPNALRAQSPAREDAQPVAWRWKTPIQHVGDGTRWGWSFASHPSTPPSSINPEPLYTHPAPDALRVAVEALEKALRSHRASLYPSEFAYVRQALAALQAGQKGGA